MQRLRASGNSVFRAGMMPPKQVRVKTTLGLPARIMRWINARPGALLAWFFIVKNYILAPFPAARYTRVARHLPIEHKRTALWNVKLWNLML